MTHRQQRAIVVPEAVPLALRVVEQRSIHFVFERTRPELSCELSENHQNHQQSTSYVRSTRDLTLWSADDSHRKVMFVLANRI